MKRVMALLLVSALVVGCSNSRRKVRPRKKTVRPRVTRTAVPRYRPRPKPASMDQPSTRIRVMKSVVMLEALAKQGNTLYAVARGSGTVISRQGHVLTNDHVVFNRKTRQVHEAIAVCLTKSFDKAPKPTCLASRSTFERKPKLDLAVIRCDREPNGRPLKRAIRWPAVVMGDSGKITPGADLYVVGYPTVGGNTISFMAGKVAGFVSEARIGARAWIKTDAIIAPGVSGGAAFDMWGRLVAVPTQLVWRPGSPRITLGQARPINRAREAGLLPGVKTRTARGGASYLIGKLVNQKTSVPLKGVTVLVIKPGKDVRKVKKSSLRAAMHTSARSDSQGNFKSGRRLAHGSTYGLYVFKRGYHAIRVNGAVRVRPGAKPYITIGELKLLPKK